MAVIAFPLPTDIPTCYVKTMRWERFDQDVTSRGIFGVQSVATMAPLWKVAVTFDIQAEGDAGTYQSLIMRLDGSRNQLSLYNAGRPTPKGTYTGILGTTTISSGASGSNTITLSNANYTTSTLKAGDFIGVGSGLTQQVVMVTADATASAGSITATVYPALRNTVTGGTATLQYPRALFRSQSNVAGWDYSTVVVDGMSLDLLEDVRP